MNKPLPQTDCTPGESLNEPIAVGGSNAPFLSPPNF